MPTNEALSGEPGPRGASSRPSLIGPGSSAQARPASILQALQRSEGVPPVPPRLAQRRIGLLVSAAAALLLMGIAWTLRPQPQDLASAREAAAASRVAQAPVGIEPASVAPAPQPALPAAPTLPARSSDPPASAAARIENLADASPPQPAPTRPGQQPWPAPAVSPMPSLPDTKREPATADARPPVRTAHAGDVPKPSAIRRSDKPAAATLAERAQGKSPDAGASAPARTTAAASARRDADVDIVSALISQIEARPATGSGRAATQWPTRESAAPNGPAAGAEPPDNIADLVASCRTAPGRTDARACRARICKGYWGKAEACPARERNAAERAARKLLELQARNGA